MLELYHNDMSTCAAKVRFILAAKGLDDWVDHHLNLRAAEQHSPRYLALNPAGVVPTLVDDGRVIVESTVICEYLDDAYPDPPMRPDAPLDRARMRLWSKHIDEGTHAAAGVVSTGIAFRYQKLAGGEEAARKLLAGMPDAAKRERHRSTIFEGVASPFFADAIRRFDDLLARMETALGENDWLAGPRLSIADAVVVPYVARLDQLCLAPMWDRRPRVGAWYARIQGHPAYAQGLGKWFNPGYVELMAEKGAEAWPRVAEVLAG